MKRTLAFFISVILVFSFSACGKESDGQTSVNSGGSSESTDTSFFEDFQTVIVSQQYVETNEEAANGDGVTNDSEAETDGEESDEDGSEDAEAPSEDDPSSDDTSVQDENTSKTDFDGTVSSKPSTETSEKLPVSTSGSAVSGSSTEPVHTSSNQTSTTKPNVTTEKTETTTVAAPPEEPEVEPSGPAPSYPIKGSMSTSSGADYNSPKVSYSRIKPGAGPLTDHKIYVGTNNFMFLGETVGDYTGANLYSDPKLKKLADMMNERDSWAKDNGIKLYLMICPNKATVYSDYVPSSLKGADYTRLDQVYDYLSENSTVELIDLRSALKSARTTYGDSLYYKYDTHWTQNAGFVAYTELMNHVTVDLPSAVYYPSSSFNVNTYETYMKDMCYYLGFYDKFYDEGPVYSLKQGPDATLVTRKNDGNWGQFLFAYQWPSGYRDNLKYFKFRSKNTSAPSVYVYRDSFSIALVPFIKESFYESTFDWDRNFSRSEILNSGADTVIIQVVEKSIAEILQTRTFID